MENKKGKKSPGIALLLAFIPGLGAIYNEDLVKGVSYIGIFAFIIYLLASNPPGAQEVFLALGLTGFYVYTIIDSYNAAKRIQKAEVEEKEKKSQKKESPKSYEKPADPVLSLIIIIFGLIFLLINLDIIEWRYIRDYWPLVLIILGGKLVYNSLKGGKK